MILYIDSTDFNQVIFAASDGSKLFRRVYKIGPHKSHATLAKLDDFLVKSKSNNLKSKISKIVVNKGPGSYTGVRVGISIAMALGLGWNVPVKAVAASQFNIGLV